MQIWVDADATPRDVKDVVYRASSRLGIDAILVANRRLEVPAAHGRVKTVEVDGGPDIADQYIAEHAAPGDVVVTQDIPLAAVLVPRDVVVLDPRGDEHTPESIGERLSIRDFMEQARSAGMVTGGPAPFGPKEKQAFSNALDRVLTRQLRSAR